jgi:hypothetical protein
MMMQAGLANPHLGGDVGIAEAIHAPLLNQPLGAVENLVFGIHVLTLAYQ